MPASQRVRECTAVNVLKLTTHRDTVSNATRFYSAPPRQLCDEMRSRIAFNGWVGGKNQLAHLTELQDRLQRRNTQLRRPYPIKWG